MSSMLPPKATFEGVFVRRFTAGAGLALLLTLCAVKSGPLHTALRWLVDGLSRAGTAAIDGVWGTHPGVLALLAALPGWGAHLLYWRTSRWSAPKPNQCRTLASVPPKHARLYTAAVILAVVTLLVCLISTLFRLGERTWPETALAVVGMSALVALLQHALTMLNHIDVTQDTDAVAGVTAAGVAMMAAFVQLVHFMRLKADVGVVLSAAFGSGLAVVVLTYVICLLVAMPPLPVQGAEPASGEPVEPPDKPA